MSSYELLELIEFLPEIGAFQTALRGGEFTETEKTQRSIAEELSKLRSIQETVATRKQTTMKTFPTVAEMKELVAQAEATEERREDFYGFADLDRIRERRDADDMTDDIVDYDNPGDRGAA